MSVTKEQSTNQCPRCPGLVPTNENPGKYAGALSRADNSTYICSACGTDEAVGAGPVPPQFWPIYVIKC